MPRTQVVDLNFSNLVDLDEGRIDKLLLINLARTAQDCITRPGDKSKRKVTLEFIFEPIADPDLGDCAGAKCEVECKTKLPVYRSRPFEMSVSNRGFAFNKDFPEELDQAPLFDQGDDE